MTHPGFLERLPGGPRLRRWLASRRIGWAAAALAVLLTSPALFTGLQTEDWVQRQLVRSGTFSLPSRVNLYGHHGHRSLEEVERLVRDYKLHGWFPWITHEHFDVSFWRPLSSLTHHLDYRVWPDTFWLMHAQSLLWYGLLALAVAALYRRLVQPAWLAGAAALLYAVDDAHGHAVGWLVNRNGIMAALFGVLAIHAHDRWRREGWRPGALVSAALLALGLLSAELALCAAGYLVAHVLFLDPAPRRDRYRALLPLAGVLLAWAFAYRRLGHHAFGSGLYIDPLSEPVAFVMELLGRAAVLLLGQLGAPPSNAWVWLDTSWHPPLVAGAVAFLAFALWLLWPLLEREPRARFWAAGMVLSLPPACATFPEDRLLFFVGVGAMPLVALFVRDIVGGGAAGHGRRRAPAFALAGFWVILHAAVAPAALPYRTLYMHRYDARMQRAADSLFSHIRDPAEESLVVINGEDFYFVSMLPLTRVARQKPTVFRMMTLAGTRHGVTLHRLDDHHLEVRPERGFFSEPFNRIFRGRSHPMPRGRMVSVYGVDIIVTDATESGEPLAATFRFTLSLDDPKLVWTVWKDGRYQRISPPAVGETLRVEGI